MSRLNDEDKEKLLEIITNYKHIIENKKTESTSIRVKKDCWAKICSQFNAQSITGEKTLTQIKAAYMNMKGKLRKTLANNRSDILGNGPALKALDDSNGLLYNLIAPTITPQPNRFDDDGSDEELLSYELETEYLDLIDKNTPPNCSESQPDSETILIVANNLSSNNLTTGSQNNQSTSHLPPHNNNPLTRNSTANFPRTRVRGRSISLTNKIKEKQIEALEEKIKLTKIKQKAARAQYLYYKNVCPSAYINGDSE